MCRLNRENLVWGDNFLILQVLVLARNFIIGSIDFIQPSTELQIGIAMRVGILPAFAFEKIPDALLLLVHRIRRRSTVSS